MLIRPGRFQIPPLLLASLLFAHGYGSVIFRWVTTQNLFRTTIWSRVIKLLPSYHAFRLTSHWNTPIVEGTRIFDLFFLSGEKRIRTSIHVLPYATRKIADMVYN